MALTKADIVERIHEKVGFSKKEASEVVDSIFEVIKHQLERGEKVKVSGLRQLRRAREAAAQGPQPADRRDDRHPRPARARLQGQPDAQEEHEPGGLSAMAGSRPARAARQAVLQDRRGREDRRGQALRPALLGNRVLDHPARARRVRAIASTGGATSRRLLEIKRLLHNERYTIEGAKRRLKTPAKPARQRSRGRSSAAARRAHLSQRAGAAAAGFASVVRTAALSCARSILLSQFWRLTSISVRGCGRTSMGSGSSPGMWVAGSETDA